MLILGIETSCDETALALVNVRERSKRVKNGWNKSATKKLPQIEVLAEEIASQTKIHAPFKGVVPMLAAREHEKNLTVLFERIKEKLKETERKLGNIMNKVDLITVTRGPGLMPALLVGAAFAKALAYKYSKPLLGVNHLEGHLYAGFLSPRLTVYDLASIFPAIALIVSGGHTELVLIEGIGRFQVLGETLDDAAGEAFDKVARLLGLGYPGGLALEKVAQNGNHQAFSFPRPMSKADDYNFSFSGLKTAVLYKLREIKDGRDRRDKGGNKGDKGADFGLQGQNLNFDIAASFQEAIIDSLIIKTKKALENYSVKTLLTGGGVLANQKLRQTLENLCSEEQVSLLIPPLKYCGDNATMIALAGYFNFGPRAQSNWQFLKVDPNLNL